MKYWLEKRKKRVNKEWIVGRWKEKDGLKEKETKKKGSKNRKFEGKRKGTRAEREKKVDKWAGVETN